MYESIRGSLVRREPAAAVVETAGLAYRLHIPLSTYEVLPAVGEEVSLLLHLAIRDDEWRLYAFATDEERAIYRALMRVSGVGPVLALSLLSGFTPAEFRSTVAGEDVRALMRAKGVGRKTAERIVVELRDVWKGEPGIAAGVTPGSEGAGAVEDAVRALESLGLDGAEARKRVAKQLVDGAEVPDAAALIRRALRG